MIISYGKCGNNNLMKKSRIMCHLMSHPTFSNQLSMQHVASNLSDHVSWA